MKQAGRRLSLFTVLFLFSLFSLSALGLPESPYEIGRDPLPVWDGVPVTSDCFELRDNPRRVEYLLSGDESDRRNLLPYLLLEFDDEGRLAVMTLPTSDGRGEDRFDFVYRNGKVLRQEFFRNHPDDSYGSTLFFVYPDEGRSILTFESDNGSEEGAFPEGVYNFDQALSDEYVPPNINDPGNLEARESWFIYDRSGRPVRSVRILAYDSGFFRYVRDYRYDQEGRLIEVLLNGDPILTREYRSLESEREEITSLLLLILDDWSSIPTIRRFDASGRLIFEQEDRFDNIMETAYLYDETGFLIEKRHHESSSNQSEVERFEYDPRGNWIRKSTVGTDGVPSTVIERLIAYHDTE